MPASDLRTTLGARGPLPDDEMAFMRRFGAHVHAHAGWFMGG